MKTNTNLTPIAITTKIRMSIELMGGGVVELGVVEGVVVTEVGEGNGFGI
mgnify:CR=1 FL=1